MVPRTWFVAGVRSRDNSGTTRHYRAVEAVSRRTEDSPVGRSLWRSAVDESISGDSLRRRLHRRRCCSRCHPASSHQVRRPTVEVPGPRHRLWTLRRHRLRRHHDADDDAASRPRWRHPHPAQVLKRHCYFSPASRVPDGNNLRP